MFIVILKRTKQKSFKKKIFGFDIETCNNNKDFVLASLVYDDYEKVFYSKEEIIKELKTCVLFRDCVIFATNLSFDFFGTFFKNEDKHFKTLFRGSHLLSAKTFLYMGEFTAFNKKKGKGYKSIEFIDSLNYASLSVSQMGKIINLPKYEAPSCLGKFPKNESEWEAIKEYNLRDSYITYKFMSFLIPAFENLGATFKQTIASTSMSLFRNKYLEDEYHQPDEDILLKQFNAYYGGRTEAFKRGYFENQYYYDFNSLYPSVMRDFEYPDPNTLRINRSGHIRYIKEYEGVSHVDIYCPYMQYPLLPYRREDGRLIFPVGHFSGWYSHQELNKALELGYKITMIHETMYYTKTCNPFKGFINDLYNLRLKYKSENNIMEYVVKITMNSLYGKFCQKFKDKDNVVHESSINIEDVKGSFEFIGNYIKIKQDAKPSPFCVPIWGLYISAYARLKMHDAILKSKPIYCDTDSIITRQELNTSNELGALKLEMKIDKGIVVRPKFYALVSNEEEIVKIKGLGKRLSYLEFMGLLKEGEIEYTKFTKFKEAIRRNLIPNELLIINKEFNLQDNKRDWFNEFDLNNFEVSEPLDMDTERSLTLSQKKKYERDLYYQEKNKYNEFTQTDIFDSHAVGEDISDEEFIENEKFFALNE